MGRGLNNTDIPAFERKEMFFLWRAAARGLSGFTLPCIKGHFLNRSVVCPFVMNTKGFLWMPSFIRF